MAHHGTPLFLGAEPGEALVHCIFIHGRTQSPEDMQEHVISRLKTEGVAFILPRAEANSWYSARATEPLTAETRRQVDQSVLYVRGLVQDLENHRGVPLLIGGFSQGACLALEYAMRFGSWDGALASLTGCRVGTASCDLPFADLDCMPTYLTGSDKDPWIPVDAFANTAAVLARARSQLRCDVIPDRAHEVSGQEIAMLDEILAGLARELPG
jgi:phospholipase/carboxylesterase